MNTTVQQPVAIALLFIWIGFVCSISFMEAWLKFRAPGVTLPVGLGIGRLVFGALNKVEWGLAVIIVCSLLLSEECLLKSRNIILLIPIVLLIIQNIWLLPALDSRAQARIGGAEVSPSNLHFYFVGMEVFKVISLAVFAISLFKKVIP